MSTILDTKQLDAVGFSKDGRTEMLLLLDHLDWSEEYEHLKLLQEKLNSYLWFIESGQAEMRRPKRIIPRAVRQYVIDIRFKYPPSENCLKFLDVVRQQAAGLKTEIRYQVTEPGTASQNDAK